MVSPLDAVFGKFILSFLTMLVVGVLLTGGIIIVYALPVTLDPVSALTGFTLAALLGLGVGTINCVLFGLFPTWRNVWNVLTKPLFMVSGTFFIYEFAPPAFQHIMWWNPLVHGVALVRAGFYGSYDPYYVSLRLRARDRAQPLRDRRLPAAPARELADRERAGSLQRRRGSRAAVGFRRPASRAGRAGAREAPRRLRAAARGGVERVGDLVAVVRLEEARVAQLGRWWPGRAAACGSGTPRATSPRSG